MKRVFAIVLALAMLLGAVPAFAADGIAVYVDGELLDGSEGVIIDDRTYLPVRAICEKIGLEVDWVDETKSVILGTAPEVTQAYDEVSIYLNGEKLEGSEATIIDSLTYVPVRAICEALGAEVEWNDEERAVYVTFPEDAADDEETEDALDGKYFRLKHEATGYYLSVEYADTNNGAKIVVAADSSNDNQVWGFTSVGNGYYKVFNKNSGKSLDVSSSNTSEGVEITQYTINGGNNQQVSATLNADGSYTFVFRHSNLAITATERYTTQETPVYDDTQSFTIEYVGETPMGQLRESDGFLALDETTRERFESYVFSSLSFSTTVYTEVENKLISTNYYSLSVDEQVEVLTECLSIVPYTLVYTGEVYPDNESAAYEITEKTYIESYDVWRGTMLPVWAYSVVMEGDVEGQVHEWTMISTVEDSSVVYDAIDALARFPYAMRKFIKNLIYREDSANNYNGGGDTIWIRLSYVPSQNAIAQTLAHELGHVLDTNVTSDSALWTRAMAADVIPVSGYGNSNREEDLAEFSRLYHMIKRNPEDLKELEKVYPNRFEAYAALLYAADNEYYADYKKYYESSQKFDDDDQEPTYVQIYLPGTELVMTANSPSETGSVITFEENTGADNQIWRIRETSGKKAIFNYASGLCVNVPGNSTDSGKNLIVWNGGKGDNETTTMNENADGTYSFRFTHSNLYLGSEGTTAGSKAIQTTTATRLELEFLEITE
ncbi:MAG: RICIN domain-containing protein [Clostridia bacterium]|nr:RICIN domain-containing protein [Clostridia bacterium]